VLAALFTWRASSQIRLQAQPIDLPPSLGSGE
jgi:hypothetical protein